MRTALIIEHVPWETPHRIAVALAEAGLTLDIRRPLDGEPLPAVDDVACAVTMGGPMGADDTAAYPGLALERRWLAQALADDVPLLGVCLGSQVLARALGAKVSRAGVVELGWHEISVSEPADPLLGGLAPATTVLHWHGDVFDLPAGATALASSEMTPVQAFRYRHAWGVLFHAEADAMLARSWLAESSMVREAEAVLGEGAADILATDAARFSPDLVERSERGFAAFAELARARAEQRN